MFNEIYRTSSSFVTYFWVSCTHFDTAFRKGVTCTHDCNGQWNRSEKKIVNESASYKMGSPGWSRKVYVSTQKFKFL